MGNIKKMISVILVVVCVFAFTACGKTETLDGKWVLVKSETSDGKTYKVKGEDTKTINLQVEQTGDNQYNFKMTDTLSFSTGTIDGKYLKCTIGDTIFIYEKD